MNHRSLCRDILVVDDSDTVRRYLNITLSRNDYVVRTCSDASEACWEIDSHPPDYIISDWQMPNMNGVELCQWVRQRQRGQYIYFLLMTAHTGVFDVGDRCSTDVDDYVQKPIRINELFARLRCGERILQLERRLQSLQGQGTDAVLQDLA